MVFELKDTKKAEALYEGWQETLIWSSLQGIMGKIYVDSQEAPASAVVILGDFCFPAGKPERTFLLDGLRFGRQEFMIVVPQNRQWAELIEDCYGEKAKRVIRYGIKKEGDIFDREKLQHMVDGLPEGYTLQMMDEPLFLRCREIGWCRDWVRQYDDYELYRKHGLGAIILKEGEPVSGASSYSGYREGIEIEIVTREDYRRKGLASICGAKLILECLQRGWYPSWDAQNKWSASLAEKLGYHFDCEYEAYEVRLNPPSAL